VTNRIDIEQRLVFDEVAELYDRVRPGYPDSFVDEVCRRASLEPGARILEIGCGPGIATRSFAQRGYAMLCLEPGPRLAEIARSRLAEHPAVSVLTTTFEAWPSLSGAKGEFLAQAPEFGAVETVSEMWTARYGTATYLELMQTQSDHRMLPEETRRELLGAIAEVIDAHGSSFDLEYEARLLLAERL